MPRIYLYPELRREFPRLPPTSLASLENSCLRKYRAARHKIVWTAEAALPTFRYPMPFPIPARAWSLAIEQERPVVRLRMDDRTVSLRLKSGPPFRRQAQQLRLLLDGAAIPGEAAIYQRGDALMFKMAAWLPRPATTAGAREESMLVRTTEDSLLGAFNTGGKRIWVYNGDQLRRWSAEHARQLRRWKEDANNGDPRRLSERRARAVEKYRNRMNSAAHEIAAHVLRLALREGYAVVQYNDSEKAFCRDLPWFHIKALINEKLSASGIQVVFVGER